jgi:hypothetical protein
MVVLPTSDPPDGPTRAENALRLRRLGPSLRRVVTVPIGNAFRVSVVRTVMRAISAIQGRSGVQVVATTVEEGIPRLLELARAKTPTREEIEADLNAMYQALGVAPAGPDPSSD